LFASAAAKAAIDMLAEGRGGIFQAPFGDRSHEIQTTTWSIILIAGDDVRGTGLQAESTVNAGEELLLFVGERALQLRVTQLIS